MRPFFRVVSVSHAGSYGYEAIFANEFSRIDVCTLALPIWAIADRYFSSHAIPAISSPATFPRWVSPATRALSDILRLIFC